MLFRNSLVWGCGESFKLSTFTKVMLFFVCFPFVFVSVVAAVAAYLKPVWMSLTLSGGRVVVGFGGLGARKIATSDCD